MKAAREDRLESSKVSGGFPVRHALLVLAIIAVGVVLWQTMRAGRRGECLNSGRGRRWRYTAPRCRRPRIFRRAPSRLPKPRPGRWRLRLYLPSRKTVMPWRASNCLLPPAWAGTGPAPTDRQQGLVAQVRPLMEQLQPGRGAA